ncbi:Rrf2 family transcriptional regulator [Paenibacillus macerans]|uniref:Rrf2 family transcriptional regulator n=1 Tax=Paenibacillus macerans TaxID=44252 RepID=UPI00203D947D|nr:Rrf2 family transcriptional regulator [Paenibacillus macerans]MCM3701821.1 Rrf2 family transcriptional regulator [Paenibacillus macerans]
MNSEFTVAVHCLLFLDNKEEQMANSEQIACSVATHPARVRKVLSALRKHGLVTTKEGVGGGYSLNTELARVTLGDLYRMFARGSLHPGWCSGSEESSCQVSSNMHTVMDRIFTGGEQRLESYFDELSLSEVKRMLDEADSQAGREHCTGKYKDMKDLLEVRKAKGGVLR